MKSIAPLSLLAAVLALAMPFFGSRSDAADSRRPNLLLIITDEHNFRTLGCYRDTLSWDQAHMWGETVVETPNIDSIADDGVIFTSMYAASPVCTPSRASMFTGLYPQNTGAPKNDIPMRTDIPTLATVLSEAGYATGYVGKWHLSGEAKPGWSPEPSYGFQDHRYMYNRGHWKKFGMKPDGTPFVAARDKMGQPTSRVDGADEKSFSTDWLTDRVLDFVEVHKADPFFLVLSLPDPHTPNTVRAPYDTMFADATFSMPPTYDLEIGPDQPGWRYADEKSDDMQPMIRQYFGMVKCIDDNVGRILHKLDQDGLLDNTIVVFSSDHGDLLGEHHRVNKGTPHEASARIAFVARYPKKIRPGTIINQAANTVDWMPTFLDLMGVEAPSRLEGRNLRPLIDGRADEWDDITFMRIGAWAAAVTDRYKLIVDDTDHEPWLFDLEEDPNEIENRIHRSQYRGVVRRMAAALKAYGDRTRDPLVKGRRFQAHLDRMIRQ